MPSTEQAALILAYPGCVLFEVMLASELLGAHMPVALATPDGEDLVNSNGVTLRADLCYAEAEASRYRCVLVPGGDPTSIEADERHRELLRRLDERRAVLGGICAGVAVLAEAGVLVGRKATHSYRAPSAPPELVEAAAHLWEGVDVQDGPVCADGHVVTAAPWGHVSFAVAVLRALELVGPEHGERLWRYYTERYPGGEG